MIRRATFADIPALRAAFARLLVETDAAGPGYPVHDATALDTFTLTCAQRLERDPALLCYVATDAAGALQGFLAGEIAQRLIGVPIVFGAAHWLYVYPEARGQGVARALVRAGTDDLARAGITHVELAARSGDLQWAQRGWIPYLVHYVLPLEAVVTAAAARAAPPTVDAPPPLPVAATNGGPPTVRTPPRRPPRRGRRASGRRRRRSPAPRPPQTGAEPCS